MVEWIYIVQALDCYNVSMELEKRIKDKIEFNECWIWTACKTNQGYGLVHDSKTKKNVLAHRYLYELAEGTIPEGLVIDHICKVTSCVNPEHLEAVTQKENFNRANNFWMARTQCEYGHDYTPENTIYWKSYQGRICVICYTRRKAESAASRRAKRKVLREMKWL
jgi:hypothetical protein